MIEVEFHQPNGDVEVHGGEVGASVMDVAVDNGVPGIVAQCGGGCSCCTCHVWLEAPNLPPAHQDEMDLLAYAWGASERSRLSCQIELTDDMSRVVVSVPEQQA